MSNVFDPSSAVYTPAEASTFALREVEQAEHDDLRGYPLDIFGGYVPPARPGELVIVQGQTSNYKSAALHFFEREGAKRLQVLGRGNEIIVHVSVEELIEPQMYLHLGHITGDSAGDLARGKVQDWSRLRQAAVQVGTVPIFRIGASLARAEDMPNLYLSNMFRAIKELVSGAVTGEKLVLAGIFLDYLQAFPIDPEVSKAGIDGQRRLQVRQDIYRSKDMAAYFQCPVFLAAQSKQSLTGANPPYMIPGVYDIEETSAGAQRADRVFSLWLPKTSYPLGKRLPADTGVLEVAEDDLYIKVCKQRGGMPAGRSFHFKVDYIHNTLAVAR